MINVRQFYNHLQFPGHYCLQDLQTINNAYLLTIDKALSDKITVLDVGCGTGLISNLFALHYPQSQFTAIDFADSIDYARRFAKENNITNVKFIKQDFIKADLTQKYDVVICQGVLHHIPEYKLAAAKLAALTGHKLVVGVYHPWGQWLKKFFRIDYKNHMLYQDQELNPLSLSFSARQVIEMFDKFELEYSYPSSLNIVSHIESLLNYKNGGLTTYVFNNHIQPHDVCVL